jgi:hypothetical protein
MASLEGEFDATTVEPSQPFDLLPEGEYRVQIIKSSKKDTKKGDGSYLELEMEVLEGSQKGRKIWDILNLWSPSDKAREIAAKSMSAICHATGVLKVTDSEQVHFKPMTIQVSIQPPKDGYSAKNQVKGYRVPGMAGTSATPAAPRQAPATTAAATQPGSPVPPWQRKTA